LFIDVVMRLMVDTIGGPTVLVAIVTFLALLVCVVAFVRVVKSDVNLFIFYLYHIKQMHVVMTDRVTDRVYEHYCYILRCPNNVSTYNGYTIDLERRLRQHNRALAGGAKATARNAPFWSIAFFVTSKDARFTKNVALSLEWSIHFPTNRRPRPKEFQGIDGRIRALQHVFSNPKFCPVDPIMFDVWVSEDLMALTHQFIGHFPNVHITSLGSLGHHSLLGPSGSPDSAASSESMTSEQTCPESGPSVPMLTEG
jgi:predicted GIY-YIG superfamily endonuclease